MPALLRCSSSSRQIVSISIVLLGSSLALRGQAPACPAVAEHSATPASTAYGEGRYGAAEDFYEQELAKQPQDIEASAGLVHTLLHERKVTQAATQANAILSADPHSAASLTALAEVQLHQGQPWLALETLNQATAANPCYARIHLIRSRALRIDSMYASERKEIQSAYDLDPTDPDIQHEWQSIVSPARDIDAVDKSLATMKDLDEDTRKKAEASMRSMLPLLFENSQTCQGVPAVESATLPLQQTMADGKHVDGYRLDAEFPKSKGKLIVDTAASGIFISKTLSDLNGFQRGADDPEGTVHVDSVRIGPLEFHNCIVGVSDAPFAGKADGFIGTDIFASWLITLDYRIAKMILAPLPPKPGILPGDRSVPPELADFTPVYHRRQYLLVPLTFGNQSRKLFMLSTGMRFSAMNPEAAHSLSKITMNFTNPEMTAQGTKVNFYREVFDMKLGNLPQIHQGHILELDPAAIDRNAGFQIAGMLGLDVLQPLTLHLDYRDGLVKFESTEAGVTPLFSKPAMIASAAPAGGGDDTECAPLDSRDRPINSTIEARVTGSLDSAHLKPGKEVYVRVVYGLAYPGCTLDHDAILYGHVTSTSARNGNGAELGLSFDHGDCDGHAKKELSLRLIGVVAPADQSRHMHEEVPTEIRGGAQSISQAVAGAGLVSGADQDLNPGGPPHTIHPGIVVHMPDAKLDPSGGPGCSARITSSSRSVQLGAGSELILTMIGPS